MTLSTAVLADGYSALMKKAKKEGAPKNVGIYDDHAMFMCDSADEIKAAIAICDKWADGRLVSWIVLPGGYSPNDILRQHGYIGCKLDTKRTRYFSADQVRASMTPSEHSPSA